MKFSTVFLALTATLVASQDLSGLPSCAVKGLGSTGCAATDVACICKASSFISSISDCVKAACSAADVATTLAFAEKLCLSASVTLNVASLTASSTGTVAAATGSTTGAAAATTTVNSGSKTGTTAASGTSMTGSATTTAGSSTASAPAANGAMSQNPGSFGILALVAAGVAGYAL